MCLEKGPRAVPCTDCVGAWAALIQENCGCPCSWVTLRKTGKTQVFISGWAPTKRDKGPSSRDQPGEGAGSRELGPDPGSPGHSRMQIPTLVLDFKGVTEPLSRLMSLWEI